MDDQWEQNSQKWNGISNTITYANVAEIANTQKRPCCFLRYAAAAHKNNPIKVDDGRRAAAAWAIPADEMSKNSVTHPTAVNHELVKIPVAVCPSQSFV